MTSQGDERADRVRDLEGHHYRDIDGRVSGLDVTNIIALLRTLVAGCATDRALARREGPATTA